VGTLLFGRRIVGRAMTDWGTPRILSAAGGHEHSPSPTAPAPAPSYPGAAAVAEAHPTQGTMVLAVVFLLCFAVYYFANWKALADVWPVR
jgi:cytochrome c oxidase subunit 1